MTANTEHWLALKLTGTSSNRDGIGASVAVTLPNGGKLYNHCSTSVGYGSSSEPMVRFGLGKEAAAKLIEIRWPSGKVPQLHDITADRVVKVREP
jgi:hypothetical protein